MSHRSAATLAILTLVLSAAPAPAELCAVDDVPGATLLIPYFEVDLGKRRQVNTVVSIQLVGAAPALAHVTLWTDWAVPTLSFQVYLTGYDVQAIDLREIFVDGRLPQTAHADNDPDDTISPGGLGSDPAGILGSCASVLPPAPLPEALAERLRTGHSGKDIGGGCVGADHGDNRARGYITIDSVTDCSLLFPGEPGFFGSGGVADLENRLRGEYYITERAGRGMAAAQAVALEAGSANGAGDYTFYGRYLGGAGSDRREPLATTWAVRRLERLPFGKARRAVATDLIVWRDTKHSGLDETFACDQGPPWAPLGQTQIVAFDERSDAEELCFDSSTALDRSCAPLATQRITLGRGDWASGLQPGWLYLNLNHANDSGNGANFGDLAQSYVSILTSVTRLRGNTPASPLSSACEGNGQPLQRTR